MKVTKSEWDELWTLLGDDWYWDDGDVDPEETDGLEPSAIISFTEGEVFYQGKAETPPAIPPLLLKGEFGASLKTMFSRLRKSKATATIVIEVPIASKDEAIAAINKLGGKVV